MLKIVTVPNQILNQPTKKIINLNKKDLSILIEKMKQTLIAQDDPLGVGLAANQVGFNISVFLMRPKKQSSIRIFINPKIIKLENQVYKSKKDYQSKKIKLEGCLSIPKIWSPVKRAEKVLLQYQDLTGAVEQKWFRGFEAVIVQHEVDHLNGILFTQRALEQKIPLYEEKEGKLEKLEY